jgi:hypothetical protein
VWCVNVWCANIWGVNGWGVSVGCLLNATIGNVSGIGWRLGLQLIQNCWHMQAMLGQQSLVFSKNTDAGLVVLCSACVEEAVQNTSLLERG